MASVSIQIRYADGDIVTARARGASSFPDALAQLRAEAVHALHDAVAELLAVEGDG